MVGGRWYGPPRWGTRPRGAPPQHRNGGHRRSSRPRRPQYAPNATPPRSHAPPHAHISPTVPFKHAARGRVKPPSIPGRLRWHPLAGAPSGGLLGWPCHRWRVVATAAAAPAALATARLPLLTGPTAAGCNAARRNSRWASEPPAPRLSGASTTEARSPTHGGGCVRGDRSACAWGAPAAAATQRLRERRRQGGAGRVHALA